MQKWFTDPPEDVTREFIAILSTGPNAFSLNEATIWEEGFRRTEAQQSVIVPVESTLDLDDIVNITMMLDEAADKLDHFVDRIKDQHEWEGDDHFPPGSFSA